MKPSGLLAVILSASLPGSAFAQNYSASRAGTSGGSAASGAIGTISVVPSGFGSVSLLPLSAPSLAPGLTPVPGISAASAIEVVGAIPTLMPAGLAATATEPYGEEVPLPHAVGKGPAVPAALSAVRSAASKDEKPGAQTFTEKIAAMFDGGAKKTETETPLDPSGLKAFIVRHGQPMTEITMAEAAAHGGKVRLLTAKNDPSGLNEKHAAQVASMLGRASVKAVQKEALAVDWAPKAAAAAEAAEQAAPKTLGAKLLWPIREAKFLAKTFAASIVKPLPSEILGGIATKSFPLVTSVAVYWTAVGPSHPFALAGLIGLSVFQEVFHGFYLKSWNNFQESLRRARGFNYQMFFNLAYMQGFGTLYRLLSWTANPSSVTPPWSVHYWKDMAVMSVVGTFFGVLGYNSLNALYAKGTINRWQHSGIQQIRDLSFLLAAPFFASGSMTMFWGIFLFQQSLDLAIAIWAGRAKAREIVFVASAPVAASAEFKDKYPAAGVAIEPPLKQAGKAVVDNPLVRLMTWPARALWKLARGEKK